MSFERTEKFAELLAVRADRLMLHPDDVNDPLGKGKHIIDTCKTLIELLQKFDLDILSFSEDTETNLSKIFENYDRIYSYADTENLVPFLDDINDLTEPFLDAFKLVQQTNKTTEVKPVINILKGIVADLEDFLSL